MCRKTEKDLNEIKSFIPLNENGEEMTYDEITEYVNSLPIIEGEKTIEDIAFFIEGDLEEWARSKGGVPIEEYMNKNKNQNKYFKK